MKTDLVEQVLNNQKLKEIQKSVLIAHLRGLINEEQAMRQLGLEDYDALVAMMEKAGLNPMKSTRRSVETRRKVEKVHSGSLIDGYLNYWQSQDLEE